MKKIFFTILAIVITVFLVLHLYPNKNAVQDIQMKDLKQMLVSKDVDRIEIVNREIVKIYLKSDKLNKYQRLTHVNLNKISKNSIHFEMRIGDEASFENILKEFQSELSDNEKIYASTKIESNYLSDLIFSFWLPIVLLLPFIFWLLFLIDILKSNFNNSVDKLIWILVITLIPIIGLILYPIIGKKQKIKK
jgi:ATP-dependent Zn protease